ncbi:MAG TPA: hypothetical protein VKB46_10780 [Pyrinomonadaceae bacterium]|nr:hypothetical protein [Pyrinomonadaceae bacterium]
MLKVSRIQRFLIALLAPLTALLLSTPTISTTAQKSKDETRSVSSWTMSDDGLKRRIEIRGKAEFNDDYTDILNVSEGGYVRIEEERDGHSRRYEVRHDLGGSLTRTYYVDGRARALDDSGRAWLAKIVLDTVRQSGIDADKRVQKILRQGGVSGVLAEIALINGDYAKRNYFEALVRNGNLNAAALQSVLAEAARQISSDYEQAQLLIAVAPILTGKEGALPSYFEATATIKSDYERARVLTTLLRTSAPGRELLIRVASSATSITSDYEKAGVLKQVAALYLDDPSLRAVFFQAVGSIQSDYEHHRVLTAVLKTQKVSDELLTHLLDSATRISSDYEKASFLLEASSAYTGDARLRSAFLKVVETIKSDYERGRVLSTLLKNKQIG